MPFKLGKAFAFHFFFCFIIYPFTYFKVLFLIKVVLNSSNRTTIQEFCSYEIL